MEKLEREGDRVYMPPEMLRGVFVKAADVFRSVCLRGIRHTSLIISVALA
jgi:hypothetical protein